MIQINTQWRKSLPFTAISIFSVVALTACGGSSSNTTTDTVSESPTEQPSVLTGQFLDSPVQGLEYTTESQSGITNANGEFRYIDGEKVTFNIGDIQLPEVLARPVINPLNLANTNDLNNITASNIARLLQSLDEDAQPDNGITITEQARSAALVLSLDFASEGFEDQVVNFIANSGSANVTLIDHATAMTHLAESLTLPTTTIEDTPSQVEPEQGNQNPDATNNPETPDTDSPDMDLPVDTHIDDMPDTTDSGCGTTHPMVGFTTQLSNRAHSVSGTATIIDNCTIEVTNFTYDGGGLPGVIFYGGVNGNYFSSGFPIGENIFGRAFNNETFTITLDDPSELDRLNGISVWCVRAGVSFGDGIFSSP